MLAIFAPHTRVLHLERGTKSTNQAGFESIKISTCSLLFYDMSRFLSSRVFYAFGTVSAFSTKPCKCKRTTWVQRVKRKKLKTPTRNPNVTATNWNVNSHALTFQQTSGTANAPRTANHKENRTAPFPRNLYF